MAIEKRFPATLDMDISTFLNDKRVDAELYAIYQQYSQPKKQPDGTYLTIVQKKDMPIQTEIAKKLGIKTTKTIRTHRDYLIQQGFLIEKNDYYILPNQEDIFFMIPLETLQFLNDTLKEQVIKIYIYLGQRWKFKKGEWVFTKEELMNHIGLKRDSRSYEIINNALLCLTKLDLISFASYYEQGTIPIPKMRLTNFNLFIQKGNF